MVEIRNFKRVCVGSGHPANLIIEPISGHESSGISAAFYVSGLLNGLKRGELRRKEGRYALFVFHFTDLELPDWWKNSEIVWELEANDEKAQ